MSLMTVFFRSLCKAVHIKLGIKSFLKLTDRWLRLRDYSHTVSTKVQVGVSGFITPPNETTARVPRLSELSVSVLTLLSSSAGL